MSNRNAFTDPSTGSTYVWAINHSTEQRNGRSRSINEMQLAASGWGPKVAPVVQQGADEPLTLELGGTCEELQHQAFLLFYAISMSQTIVFHDGVSDSDHEARITAYQPQFQRVVRSVKTGDTHQYTYTMTIEFVT